MAPLVAENPDDDAILTFARHLTANNAHGTAEAYMNSYKATDPAFRTAVGNAISTQEWSDEFANIEGTGLPVMVVFGKQERAINTSYMDGIANKWKGMIYHIDGAWHFVNAEQPEQFNALLVEFAAELL